MPEPLEIDAASAGQVRVHPHAGFERVRRLHRKWPGYPGFLSRTQRRLNSLHVSQRRGADRRWTGALGLSEKARPAHVANRSRHANRYARLRPAALATGTMGYKHREADPTPVKAALEEPNFLLKIIPHVEGSPRICELVKYRLEEIALRGAWTGPSSPIPDASRIGSCRRSRFSRSSPQSTSAPTLRSASGGLSMTICSNR